MTTTELLLAAVDGAYDKRSWHGPNLRGALRGVTVEEAAWRPTFAKATVGKPDRRRHNIWELVVHSAYWKYDIRRRLTGAMSRSFALDGSNFWPRPIDGSPKEWKNDLALLDAEHATLRDAIAAFPAKRWTAKAPGKPFNFEGLVRGVAAHDLYHAGQIQLIKALQ
jgi:hypothetical protein